MPAGENVGQAWIGLGLEDQIGAELRRIEQEVKRTLDRIDRMDAEAEIDANIRDFQKDALWVREQMAELDKLEATPEVKADKKALRDLNRELGNTVQGLRLQKQELKAVADAEDRVRARADASAKAQDKAAAAAQKRLRTHAQALRENERRSAAAARLLTQQEAAERRMIQTHSQAIDIDRRRAVEVEKLRQAYAKMLGQQAKIQRSGMLGNAFDQSRLRQFNAELANTRSRILELGGSVADLDKETERSNGRFGQMLSSLASVRIQMGFISGTLRQVATGFTVLGPVIFSVAGQIASLVGVAGTGLAGALAVGAAGASGFALSLGGIIAIAKPLVGELDAAFAASRSYNDAIRKYGKGSTEAATAQEKLNQTLKGVSPEAKRAFMSIGGLNERWNALTRDAGKRSFFDLIGSGVQAAYRLMPMFARESTRTFDVATRSAQKWTDALSSSGARQGIQQIMSNFREALPDINAGMLSLGKAFGRIAVSASKVLPELMSGFSDWADNIADAVGSGGLDSTIRRLVDHMRQIGRFAQSAGSMLATFFNAGANEGASLLNTLTNIFNRWNAWMQTASGQRSLANFFSQANALGSSFISTLVQMSVALFEFSQAFAPLSQGFIMVIGGVSRLVAELMSLQGARAVITGLGAALATAFVASKVTGIIAAIGAVRTAISGLQAAAAAGGLRAALAALFTIPAGPWMALAAAGVGIGVALSQIIGPAEAAAGSLAGITDDANNAKDALDRLRGVELDSVEAASRLARAKIQLGIATDRYRAIEEKGRAGSRAGRQALLDMLDAENAVKRAREDLNTANKQGLEIEQERSATTFKRIGDLQKEVAAEKSKLRTMRDNYQATKHMMDQEDRSEAIDAIRKQRQEIQRLNKELANTKQRNIGVGDYQAMIEQLNAGLRRGLPLARGFADEWARVNRDMVTGGKIAQDAGEAIANVFPADPGKAGRTIQAYAKALDSGLGKQAKEIVLNPKLNDKQVLSQLRGLQKQVNPVVNPRVNKGKADADLRNLGKGKTATIDAKANTRNAEREINRAARTRARAEIAVSADIRPANRAIQAISRHKISPKRVDINASTRAAEAGIKKVNGVRIAPKELKINADDSEARSANSFVQGIRDKLVQVRTQADTSGVSAVISALASVPRTITTVIRQVTQKSGAQGAAFTSDRREQQTPMERTIDNAFTRARSTDRQSGRYSRPTLLVGEENRSEYVIAMNPAYRAQNEGYLAMAADELGYNLIEAAARGKGNNKKTGKNGGGKNKKPPHTRPQTAGTAVKYPMYDWHRGEVQRWADEAQHRENVRTQDIEAGRSPSYNPKSILNAYLQQQTALGNLESWIKSTITRYEKKGGYGKGSAGQEIKAVGQINSLERKIKQERNKRPKVKRDKDGNETKASKEAQRTWEKKIDKLTKKLDKARANRQKAADKTRNYNTEIGRFQRELDQTLPGEKNTLAGVIQRWQDIAAGRIDDPTTPETEGPQGTTGGASGTPIGIQMANFDQQRYEFFKQFGSNVAGYMGMGSPGGAPSSGSGGPGMGFRASPPPTPGPGYSPMSGAGYIPGAGVNAPLPQATGAGRVGAAPESGARIVNQHINISEPPPDAHTFSRDLAWEAQAGY